MTVAGQIEQQSASYRQGLVLGLTMAEIMLLLVFCLLIAAGVTLSRERAEREKAVQQAQAAQDALRVTDTLASALKQDAGLAELITKEAAANKSAVDEFWRKLVESYDVAQTLQKNGLTPNEVKGAAAFFAKANELRKDGVALDDVKVNAELARAYQEVLKSHGLDTREPSKIREFVEVGIAAYAPKPEQTGHRWPPIIKLSEAGGYNFAVGSAELTEAFEAVLKMHVADQIVSIARDYDVNVIEVVGHTDEQPIGARASNLDRDLAGVLRGATAVNLLKPADNAGLGLARSVAVVKVLLRDPRLSNLRILPLSGAQLIQTDETLTSGGGQGDVKERRRIEIRMRKAG